MDLRSFDTNFSDLSLFMLDEVFNPSSRIEMDALRFSIFEKCKAIDDVTILYLIRLGVENKRLADGFPKEIKAMWTNLYTDISDLISQKIMKLSGIDAHEVGSEGMKDQEDFEKVEFPLERSCSFPAALRYMRCFPDAFMSCADGEGWYLYIGYGERGYFGRHKEQRPIARVVDTPDDLETREKYGFWGNWWKNPKGVL